MIAFHDLPAHHFPFKIWWLRESDDVIVWEAEVEGPGVLRVAGQEALGNPGPVSVVLSQPDGTFIRVYHNETDVVLAHFNPEDHKDG